MRKIIALFFAVLAGPFAHAQFSTGIGGFAQNLNGTTTSVDAKKTLIGPVFVPVQVRYSTKPFLGKVRVAPYLEFTHLSTTVLKSETPDGTAKRNFAIVGSPFEFPINDRWFVSAGPSFMYYEIKGKGGTKVVRNGTGSTTFGVPGKTRTSKIFLLEIGAGWLVKEFRVGADLYFGGIASERLSTSFQVTLSRSFGGKSW